MCHVDCLAKDYSVGVDTSKQGCSCKAGYLWSHLQKQCIQISSGEGQQPDAVRSTTERERPLLMMIGMTIGANICILLIVLGIYYLWRKFMPESRTNSVHDEHGNTSKVLKAQQNFNDHMGETE